MNKESEKPNLLFSKLFLKRTITANCHYQVLRHYLLNERKKKKTLKTVVLQSKEAHAAHKGLVSFLRNSSLLSGLAKADLDHDPAELV